MRELYLLLYSAETWSLTVTDVHPQEAAHQKYLRQILMIHCFDHITNKEVLQCTVQGTLSCYLSSWFTGFFGHVARLDESILAHVALQYHVDVSLNRLPDRSWCRAHIVPDLIQPYNITYILTYLEIYGGVLFAVVTGGAALRPFPTMQLWWWW